MEQIVPFARRRELYSRLSTVQWTEVRAKSTANAKDVEVSYVLTIHIENQTLSETRKLYAMLKLGVVIG